MKIVKHVVATIAAALLTQVALPAQENPPAQSASTVNPQTNSVADQLQALVSRVREKLQAGDTTETSLAPELKAFDDLIAHNPKASPDDLAQVSILKAMLYLQVFNDVDKGTALLKKIKTDYPASKIAGKVDDMLSQISKQAEAKKIQDALVPGAEFPDFSVKSLTGQPLSVASLKGKVVLIDFWATWCPPCRAELPNVIATYKQYHSQGFEIIGVSLDSDRDKLDSFLKKEDGMTWQQYFDGQGWSNALAVKYGVESIPFTVLIGPDGKIISTNLRGEALGEAVKQALAKK